MRNTRLTLNSTKYGFVATALLFIVVLASTINVPQPLHYIRQFLVLASLISTINSIRHFGNETRTGLR